MIANQKKFYSGAILLSAFLVVLVIIFLPLFNGQNGLAYLDSLYNSISKGSAYYIPKLKREAGEFSGRSVTLTLNLADERQAREIQPLFEKGGASVERSGMELKISGDLAAIMANCLADADSMFNNNGEKVAQKYGYNEKRALYNWWLALNAADRDLKKQKKFYEAKFLANVQQKAVECSYNYYKIEPQRISDKYGLVIFSLVFYVAYTLWYGFAVMNLFEGLGLRLEH
jgi:cell division protein FtsB